MRPCRHQQADVTEFSIFVGDLDLQVTDYVLTDTFRSRYPSVRGAKVWCGGHCV